MELTRGSAVGGRRPVFRVLGPLEMRGTSGPVPHRITLGASRANDAVALLGASAGPGRVSAEPAADAWSGESASARKG